jgi:hypothetical protein
MDHALKSAISQVYPCMCLHTTTYVSSYCYIRLLYMCVLILLHMCPHTAISGSYICVLILLYTPIPLDMCPYPTVFESSYDCLSDICGHTDALYADIYADIRTVCGHTDAHILLYLSHPTTVCQIYSSMRTYGRPVCGHTDALILLCMCQIYADLRTPCMRTYMRTYGRPVCGRLCVRCMQYAVWIRTPCMRTYMRTYGRPVCGRLCVRCMQYAVCGHTDTDALYADIYADIRTPCMRTTVCQIYAVCSMRTC